MQNQGFCDILLSGWKKWATVSFRECGAWSWELQQVQRHTAAAKYTISIPQALEKKMASEQNPVTELCVSFWGPQYTLRSF